MRLKKHDTQFNGFGFPVNLCNWPHIEVDGSLEPDIDYELLQDYLFKILPEKPSQLSGAEIKFIRHHMGMTQFAFAKWIETVDTSTIAKWEAKDLHPTGMGPDTEKSIRIKMYIEMQKKIRRKTIKIDDMVELLKKRTSKRGPLSVDFSELQLGA